GRRGAAPAARGAGRRSGAGAAAGADERVRGMARAHDGARLLRTTRLRDGDQPRLRDRPGRRGTSDFSRAGHRVSARAGVVMVVLSAAAVAVAGCASAVTEDRVERAIAPAFANLVHAQLGRMGLHEVPVSELRVVASCYRVAGGRTGAGEWACTVVWSGP